MTPKRERPDKTKAWPEQARPNYLKLFGLQERLRAHLKMAQQLALKSYQLNYPENPRKTNPIRIAGRYEDYLKKYREDQWPEIKFYLLRMRQEIQAIKAAYKGGRPPKWYEAITGIETLTEQIWEKMELIQAHLIITLKDNNQALKASNQVIIEETAGVLGIAYNIREALLSVPLDRAKIGLDKYGFEAIIDLSEQHYLDLTPIWQQSRQKKTRG